MKTELSTEERAKELSIKYGCNVNAIVFKDSEDSEEIIGFIKEPSRFVKLRCLDKAMSASMTASAEMFDAILLKEESDPRFSSDKSCDDKYYLGGVLEAFKTIEMSMNTLKKN